MHKFFNNSLSLSKLQLNFFFLSDFKRVNEIIFFIYNRLNLLYRYIIFHQRFQANTKKIGIHSQLIFFFFLNIQNICKHFRFLFDILFQPIFVPYQFIIYFHKAIIILFNKIIKYYYPTRNILFIYNNSPLSVAISNIEKL